MSAVADRMKQLWSDPVWREAMIARRKAGYTAERAARAVASRKANGKADGLTPWNKGLSKEDDYRVFLATEKSMERRIELRPGIRFKLTPAEKTKRWRLKHPEIYRAQLKRHREKHKQRRAEQARKWDARNIETRREYSRTYRRRRRFLADIVLTSQSRQSQMPPEFPIFSEELASVYQRLPQRLFR